MEMNKHCCIYEEWNAAVNVPPFIYLRTEILRDIQKIEVRSSDARSQS